MIGLLIAFIVALLVIYKLYSVLGYHDENDTERNKIKEIKALETKIEDIVSKLNTDKQAIVRDEELENKIFRNLDKSSQDNLNKILQLSPSFSITWFINHCDFLFTKIFDELKSQNLVILEEYSNEQSLIKFKEIIKSNPINKTLIKINDIKITNITLDDNNNAIIDTIINSDQMIKYQNQFPEKSFDTHIRIGAGSINNQDSKWIILDFDNL